MNDILDVHTGLEYDTILFNCLRTELASCVHLISTAQSFIAAVEKEIADKTLVASLESHLLTLLKEMPLLTPSLASKNRREGLMLPGGLSLLPILVSAVAGSDQETFGKLCTQLGLVASSVTDNNAVQQMAVLVVALCGVTVGTGEPDAEFDIFDLLGQLHAFLNLRETEQNKSLTSVEFFAMLYRMMFPTSLIAFDGISLIAIASRQAHARGITAFYDLKTFVPMMGIAEHREYQLRAILTVLRLVRQQSCATTFAPQSILSFLETADPELASYTATLLHFLFRTGCTNLPVCFASGIHSVTPTADQVHTLLSAAIAAQMVFSLTTNRRLSADEIVRQLDANIASGTIPSFLADVPDHLRHNVMLFLRELVQGHTPFVFTQDNSPALSPRTEQLLQIFRDIQSSTPLAEIIATMKPEDPCVRPPTSPVELRVSQPLPRRVRIRRYGLPTLLPVIAESDETD